ncbi:MAG: transcriptional regulator [Flavobacteriia bacterium]|jgi:hypothetical protein
MNYIKHLTAVLLQISNDNRLNASHVSLYIALFQLWNVNRFQNPLSINRNDTMAISKIGSKSTYHKCLVDLNNWKYLEYKPSHNPMIGSLVNLYTFGTSDVQVVEQVSGQVPSQVVGQALVPSINNTKQNKLLNTKNFVIPSIEEIKDFFKNDLEADKFFNYYEANGWLIGGKAKMKNWNAAAKNWLLNSKKFNPKEKENHYHTNENKQFDIPL